MIFYFSGTGNSKWAAEKLAAVFNDSTIAIGHAQIHHSTRFQLTINERVGFVFPIHSWGIPLIVKRFIQQLDLENYRGQLLYAVFTCGDECGLTNLQFIKLIRSKGWESHHIYAIRMPNNYIAFPGFDVDDNLLEQEKKQNALVTILKIIDAISSDTLTSIYIKGTNSFLKSKIIYPLFCKYALNSKPFYSTQPCTGCGVCVKKCPTNNISFEKKRPVWSNNCTQCLACIHYCPERAIEYGKLTQKKGRYIYDRS